MISGTGVLDPLNFPTVGVCLVVKITLQAVLIQCEAAEVEVAQIQSLREMALIRIARLEAEAEENINLGLREGREESGALVAELRARIAELEAQVAHYKCPDHDAEFQQMVRDNETAAARIADLEAEIEKREDEAYEDLEQIAEIVPAREFVHVSGDTDECNTLENVGALVNEHAELEAANAELEAEKVRYLKSVAKAVEVHEENAELRAEVERLEAAEKRLEAAEKLLMAQYAQTHAFLAEHDADLEAKSPS